MSVDPARVRAVFLDAVEKQPPDAWDRFLDEACTDDGELRRQVACLLDAHRQAGSFLAEGAVARARAVDLPPVQEAPGTVIGPYKLLEQIGEGGFGVVFMAEQARPVRRRVALKVVKPGMDTRQVVARFEAERQALALMDHPNIAHVFDGGETASGRPYFVMELVRGVPMTEFCDANHLSVCDRLELFVNVCQAVQHAHVKGIIHRDLKPTNILVTPHDGRPVAKVIDFGIAKATGQPLTEKTLFTNFAQMIGTPLYMSPEQTEMGPDIDTRADIYSLGVVLYELLTGTTPFDRERLGSAAYDEVRRIIREEEPPKPSTRLSTLGPAAVTVSANRVSDLKRLSQLVRGELDWIVMKALEKDRNRRYETAGAFADDIRRYLRDEPVLACPPSLAYRVRKFVRRHRGPVLAAAAVLLALVGGTAAATVGLVRAWQAEADAHAKATAADEARTDEAVQRRLATEEAAIARAVNDFLQNDLLRLADSQAQADLSIEADPDVKVRTLLDRAAGEVGKRFAGQPRVEAAVRQAIGDAYRGLGEFDHAITHLTRARDLRIQTLGPGHPDTLVTLNNLALAYRRAGRTSEAIGLFEQVRDRQVAALGQSHSDTLETLNNLADTYRAAGRTSEAIRLHEQVRDQRTATLGPEHPSTLTSLNNLALAYESAGRTSEAIRLYEQARDQKIATLGPGHPRTLATLDNLAGAYRAAGRTSEAIRLHEQVRDQRTATLGPGHPDTLITLNNLALAYRRAGRTAEAIQLYEQVRDQKTATLGPEHPSTLTTLGNLAAAYQAAGRTAEAIRLLERVREHWTATLGPNHARTLSNLITLAGAYRDAGRTADAIRLLEQVREQSTSALGPNHPHTLTSLNNLASAYRSAGRTSEAIPLYEQVLHQRTATLGPDHPSTLNTMNSLGTAYSSARRLDKSVPLFEETLRRRRAKLGDDHPDTISTAFNLAANYRNAGRLDEAAALFEDWVARSRTKFGPDHGQTLAGLGAFVEVLARAKQFDRAAAACRQLLEVRSRKLPADHPTRTVLLAELGSLLLQSDRPAEAEPVLRECLALREKKQPDDWTTFHTRSLLGGALLAQQKPTEAEPLLLQGYEGLKQRAAKIPAANQARVTEALDRLVQLAEATGRPAEAVKWRKELDTQKEREKGF
jgi:eukaryotic-like serine/threonine-protein kinase